MKLALAVLSCLPLSYAAWEHQESAVLAASGEGRPCNPSYYTARWWFPGTFKIQDPLALCSIEWESSLVELDDEFDQDPSFSNQMLATLNDTEGASMEQMGGNKCVVKLTNEKLAAYYAKTKDPLITGWLPGNKCKLRLKVSEAGVEWAQSKRCPAVSQIKVGGKRDRSCVYDYNSCGLRKGTPSGSVQPCNRLMDKIGWHWQCVYGGGDPHMTTVNNYRYKTNGVGEALISTWKYNNRMDNEITACFFEPNGDGQTFIKSTSMKCGDDTMITKVMEDLTLVTYYFDKDLQIRTRRPAQFKGCPRPGQKTYEEDMIKCSCEGRQPLDLSLKARESNWVNSIDEEMVVMNSTAVYPAIMDFRICPTKYNQIKYGLGQGWNDRFECQLKNEIGSRNYPRFREQQEFFANRKCGPCSWFQAGVITDIGEQYPELGLQCDAIKCGSDVALIEEEVMALIEEEVMEKDAENTDNEMEDTHDIATNASATVSFVGNPACPLPQGVPNNVRTFELETNSAGYTTGDVFHITDDNCKDNFAACIGIPDGCTLEFTVVEADEGEIKEFKVMFDTECPKEFEQISWKAGPNDKLIDWSGGLCISPLGGQCDYVYETPNKKGLSNIKATLQDSTKGYMHLMMDSDLDGLTALDM